MPSAADSNRLNDLSLVLGDPLCQLFIPRACAPIPSAGVKRRIIVTSLFTWLPLQLRRFTGFLMTPILLENLFLRLIGIRKQRFNFQPQMFFDRQAHGAVKRVNLITMATIMKEG